MAISPLEQASRKPSTIVLVLMGVMQVIQAYNKITVTVYINNTVSCC